MKKKTKVLIALFGILLLVAILAVPLPSRTESGDRVFSAIAYKVVSWNRESNGDTFSKKRVYTFPDSLKSVEELWNTEKSEITHTLRATVISVTGDTVTANTVPEDKKGFSTFAFSLGNMEREGLLPDTVIYLTYKGEIPEIIYRGENGASVWANAVSWEPCHDLRHLDYAEEWLDESTAEASEDDYLPDGVITEIYKNCFFMTPVFPSPYTIKINGLLPEKFCVGDQILCTGENVFSDIEAGRMEADLISVDESDFQLEPDKCYKPVIYLYPESRQEIQVDLSLNGELSCTYPEYANGWTVTADPDGTLRDKNGKSYNYLYWEGDIYTSFDFSHGFCVKGEDTAKFLEETLASLGLSEKESNDFIVYWLPLMQDNPYNVITFQDSAYTDAARLSISPTPDTLIRVFMVWYPTDEKCDIPPQSFTPYIREGFCAVEWGGTKAFPEKSAVGG